MCGIIGIASNKNIAKEIYECLENLEYRGYDSTGLALYHQQKIYSRKSVGKLSNLKALIEKEPIYGKIGIGHTRWATHGDVSEENAHPHLADGVAIVHNGIIENYHSLASKYKINNFSDNDTKVLTYLISLWLSQGNSPSQVIQRIMKEVVGSYAFVCLFLNEPDRLYAAKNGSPLVVGKGDYNAYVGSDALCMAKLADQVMYIKDNQWAIIQPQKLQVFNSDGKQIKLNLIKHQINDNEISKGLYRHFMEKEIYQQTLILSKHLARFNMKSHEFESIRKIDWQQVSSLQIVGCGSAYNAALIGQIWFETLAHIPTKVDLASEYRYQQNHLNQDALAIVISQSGETKDTLEALNKIKSHGQKVVGIVNVDSSSVARESHHVFLTNAGPEIGVASTKAFTSQLLALLIISIEAAVQRKTLDKKTLKEILEALEKVPHFVATALENTLLYQEIANILHSMRTILYIGRNVCYPIALEAALKMKEISYIHAEGYPSGELKHGPIALVDQKTAVIAIAPRQHLSNTDLFVKTMSNLHSSTARGCTGIIISDKEGIDIAQQQNPELLGITMPSDIHKTIAPIVYSIPIQLLAYHTALVRGTDIDQPRNLAKSVTVE